MLHQTKDLLRLIPAVLLVLAGAAQAQSHATESGRCVLREVRENGAISHLGSCQFPPRQRINFEISAAPTADAQQRLLKLDYRERMWAH